MPSTRLLQVFFLVLASGAALARTAEGEKGALTPIPFGSEVEAADGPQFVAADAKNRPYLLLANRSQVFPVLGDGSFGEPIALAAIPEPDAVVRAAAMEGDARIWVLLARGRLWRATPDEVKRMPDLAFRPDSLAVSGAGIAVGVLPFGTGKGALAAPPRAGRSAPLLFGLSGDRWEPRLFGEAVPGREEVEGVGYVELNQRSSLELAAGAKGRTWVVNRYFYLARSVSPAGKVLVTLRGDATIRQAADDESLDGIAGRIAGERERVGPRMAALANTGVNAILGLAEARDGRLYLVGQERGGRFLDRFDPVRLRVERVPLALEYAGRLTMAAGPEGLYLAGFGAQSGRWWLPWETLETAAWKPASSIAIE